MAKRGRPVVGERKDRRLQIKLDDTSKMQLKDLSKRSGLTMSELIRRWIDEFYLKTLIREKGE